MYEIKPLKWVQIWPNVHEAETILGRMEISKDKQNNKYYVCYYNLTGIESRTDGKYYKDPEKAKAAGFRIYKKQLMKALTKTIILSPFTTPKGKAQ